ncbi:MAG: methylated-DNA--[protein]-cysteine S-methyltransferase [Bacteroidales bacterium]|nr:methylated-DNA--[protein]-cysteine S-methyltransferase [Bacteroidales bacterium]MBK7626543.1 methylated-DNA--[protein]-cysteine S-methyltransferase [Bacteroidales bacterium]
MIITANIETELGTMIAGAVEDGICLLEFSDRKMLNTEYKDLSRYLKTNIEAGESIHFHDLRLQLDEYFKGLRKEFSLALVTPGTPFQQAVWKELMNISYGTTRSYMEQSIALGNPESIRAVANANGMNRIAIIIPCHRVIGSDGSLTGYGGGLKRKRWLLDHERKHSGQSVDLTLFGE